VITPLEVVKIKIVKKIVFIVPKMVNLFSLQEIFLIIVWAHPK